MLVEFKDFVYGGTVKAEVCSISGEVIEIKSLNKTHLHSHSSVSTSGNGSSYSSTSVSSSNSQHDDIFIVDKQGEEHHVKLIDTDIGIRAGHQVQFIWLKWLDTPENANLIKIHGQYSPYIVRYNRNLDKIIVISNSDIWKSIVRVGYVKFCFLHLKLSLSVFTFLLLMSFIFTSSGIILVGAILSFFSIIIHFFVQVNRLQKKQFEEFDTVLKPAISKYILPPVKNKVVGNKVNQQHLPTY